MKNFDKYEKKYDWKKPKQRTWPNKEIEKAPIWCSVDLRDGNQALANPMSFDQKVTFFNQLVKTGFKHIEVGFPASSETDADFIKYLIKNDKIPDDVTIQVLTQAREKIIRKTFNAVKGAKNAIMHFYNSTSPIQRERVFGKSKEEVKQMAIDGAKCIKKYAKENPETNWTFEYSPENFTETEIDYAIEVINAVVNELKDATNNKIIINLPATVECSMPNVFADQIEYLCENIENRDDICISIHAHNDRGTGVASSEMALLAGADRIEGSLFGNGERTGNADILNIAMNMYTLGIDPELDFSNINELVDVYKKSTNMPIHPRHPYAGENVFIAFSGSHQNAIAKVSKTQNPDEKWNVPYLPINPADVGRKYEEIIRINSQSGKEGIAYKIENAFGIKIPQDKKEEFSYFIKDISDKRGIELTSEEILEMAKQYFEKRNIKLAPSTDDFVP